MTEFDVFELQSAKKIWDQLDAHEKKIMLEAAAGIIYEEQGPILTRLIALGLAVSARIPTSYTSQDGVSRSGLSIPGYTTTRVGAYVARYGDAVTVIEAASSRSSL